MTATEQAKQTLAEGFATGSISLEDFQAGLAALDGNSPTAATGEASTARSNKSRRATVRVQPSDDPKFGDVSIVKVLPSGTVRNGINLWNEDVLEVAQALVDIAE